MLGGEASNSPPFFFEGGVMPGEIVASNALLKNRSEIVRTYFDSAHSLRLYANDLHPLPKDASAAFVEASFPGYARISMAGKWKPVLKLEDGSYHFSSLDCTFTPTGPSNEYAYGWYLFGPLGTVLSCRLPFPALMTIGSPLTVRADVITWAASIL